MVGLPVALGLGVWLAVVLAVGVRLAVGTAPVPVLEQPAKANRAMSETIADLGVRVVEYMTSSRIALTAIGRENHSSQTYPR